MAGGSNNVTRMSPRQRMINLMYIVLTAMLALNVSSDVLNGFALVHESLNITNKNITERNHRQFLYFKSIYDKNPAKVGPWFKQGETLAKRADDLYNLIDKYKLEIARAADGENADIADIKDQENLDAAASVMLDPLTNKGLKLRKYIDSYRMFVLGLIPDSQKKKMVEAMLSTKLKPIPGVAVQPKWEEKTFENMPTVAAITLLTKLQGDIRHAESEAMSGLITSVDIGDMRVNKMDAYVIPNSNMIIRGGKYSANIVLAAIDTTQRPSVYVGGRKLSGGLYEFVPSSIGKFEYSGYIEVLRGDGTLDKRPFKSSYTVIEPMATISPTMMNVLYAGIDNPISISVPGVAMSSISASMTNGTLVRKGDVWVAHPSKVGTESVISVIAELEGRNQQVGSMSFRVRKLPDPTTYISVGDTRYKGTPRRISKASLMSARGLSAALDDDLLNINFTVISFSTVFFDQMGNAMPEVSAGSAFSERQKEQFRRLKPGKSFFITNIKAKGPDGIVRDISPMEVGLN